MITWVEFVQFARQWVSWGGVKFMFHYIVDIFTCKTFSMIGWMGYSTSDFSFSFDLFIFFNLQKYM